MSSSTSNSVAGVRGETSEASHLRARPGEIEFGVVIPARFASTRLPGKPLREIDGKPMVLHVCENARRSGASFVLVATDDARIARVVEAAGFEGVLTSSTHRSGTERIAEVVRQRQLSAESIVVNLQGDEPLLSPGSVRLVARALNVDPAAGIATLSTPIEDVEEWLNPNVVKVITNRDGYAQYFSRAPLPFVRTTEPGRTPATLPGPPFPERHIGVYAYRARELLRMAEQRPVMVETCESLEQLRALWMGIAIRVKSVDRAPPPGVDTEEDLSRVQRSYRGARA